MAKPLIAAEVIYTRALDLLDAEGLAALNAQRLAKDLKISTKTLYQQVGNRHELTRALVARHFSQLQLDFRQYGSWEKTAMKWCVSLHTALRAHPHLTQLMMVDDRKAVTDYVNDLIKAALREGYPRPLAVKCCRALATLTINHAIVEVQALLDPDHTAATEAEVRTLERNLPTTVTWILAGVRAEAGHRTSG